MNSIECELCVRRKTMYCPNSSECYDTADKPFYQNRITLLEENKALKQCIMTDHHKIHELVDVIDEVREIIENSIVIESIRETGIGFYENIKANKTKILEILDKVSDKESEKE